MGRKRRQDYSETQDINEEKYSTWSVEKLKETLGELSQETSGNCSMLVKRLETKVVLDDLNMYQCDEWINGDFSVRIKRDELGFL